MLKQGISYNKKEIMRQGILMIGISLILHPPIPEEDILLQEDGFYLLQENGGYIALE